MDYVRSAESRAQCIVRQKADAVRKKLERAQETPDQKQHRIAGIVNRRRDRVSECSRRPGEPKKAKPQQHVFEDLHPQLSHPDALWNSDLRNAALLTCRTAFDRGHCCGMLGHDGNPSAELSNRPRADDYFQHLWHVVSWWDRVANPASAAQ